MPATVAGIFYWYAVIIPATMRLFVASENIDTGEERKRLKRKRYALIESLAIKPRCRYSLQVKIPAMAKKIKTKEVCINWIISNKATIPLFATNENTGNGEKISTQAHLIKLTVPLAYLNLPE